MRQFFLGLIDFLYHWTPVPITVVCTFRNGMVDLRLLWDSLDDLTYTRLVSTNDILYGNRDRKGYFSCELGSFRRLDGLHRYDINDIKPSHTYVPTQDILNWHVSPLLEKCAYYQTLKMITREHCDTTLCSKQYNNYFCSDFREN